MSDDFECQFCDIISDKKEAAYEGIGQLPSAAVYVICCKCLSELMGE